MFFLIKGNVGLIFFVYSFGVLKQIVGEASVESCSFRNSGYLIGALIIWESCYLGAMLGVPYFHLWPRFRAEWAFEAFGSTPETLNP